MSEPVIIERHEDMSPLGRLALLLQEDGDVIVTIRPDPEAAWQNSVEFCQPFSGGGRSPATIKALRALANAMVKDNQECPIAEEQRQLTPFDFARFRTVAEMRDERDRLHATIVELSIAGSQLTSCIRRIFVEPHGWDAVPIELRKAIERVDAALAEVRDDLNERSPS